MMMNIIDDVRRFFDERRVSDIVKPNWKKVLSNEYLPKNPRHRLSEIKRIGLFILNSVTDNVSDSLTIYGPPGTGKTMSFKFAKMAVESYVENKRYFIVHVFATRSTSKVLHDVCNELGFRVPRRGFSIEDYFDCIRKKVEEGYHVHVCIDDFDNLLGDKYKYFERLLYFLTRTDGISTTLITNKIDLTKNITDVKVLSSLNRINTICFSSYNVEQCREILKDRIDLAFREGFITDEALDVLATHVANEGGDIRLGLSILRLCVEHAIKNKLQRIDSDEMQGIITRHSVHQDGERLIGTLSLSDKLIVVAVYQLLTEHGTDAVDSKDVYATQDYYRKVYNMTSIEYDTFSSYLADLSAMNIVFVKRVGRGKRRGVGSLVGLKCARDAVKYMLENDTTLCKLRDRLETLGLL